MSSIPYYISEPTRSNEKGSSFDSNRTDVIIAENWSVSGRIGEGSFGEVFEVEDIHTKRKYAIKRETLRMRRPQIKHEKEIYSILQGGSGIPQCYWHGQHEEFDCIVIDLLGPNLNQLREVTRKIPIEAVVDFGCQMVSLMEHIHKHGFVYRDIKPDNFLFSSHCILSEPEAIETLDEHGIPLVRYRYPSCEEVFRQWNSPRPQLFLVDFGLTTRWKDPETNKPFPEIRKLHKNKAGTARYASLNVHRGKPHSRRDDLESIGYLLLDLIFGSLPWTGIQARSSRAGWDRMKQIKEDTFLEDLYAGLPQGLLKYMEYTRRLRFAEEPDYESLRQFLSGSVQGPYSDLVKSPFGGHMEKKWVQKIDVDSTFLDLSRTTYHQQINDTLSQNNRDTTQEMGESSFQKLVTRTRNEQKRVGWDSHKHDNKPWFPVTDWTVPDEKTTQNDSQVVWGENSQSVTWGDKPVENSWASTVPKPWE
ncbi:unnamed protein product [Rhizopus stolonifer]